MNNELYNHINSVTFGSKYKKVDTDIILDTDLTKNDLAVYLAILRCVSYDGLHTKITNKYITHYTGIAQCRQGKSIDKLLEKGYIFQQQGENCYEYIIADISDKYMRLRLDYFTNLKGNIKDYTRKLRYLSLSNGNDRLPKLSACNKRTYISREEYKILKTYESKTDVDIYESLYNNDSNDGLMSNDVITLSNMRNDVRDDISLDEQLDQLLK